MPTTNQLRLDMFTEEEPPSIGSRPTPVVPLPAWLPASDSTPTDPAPALQTAALSAMESGAWPSSRREGNHGTDEGPLIEVQEDAPLESLSMQEPPASAPPSDSRDLSSWEDPVVLPVHRSLLGTGAFRLVGALLFLSAVALVGYRASTHHAVGWNDVRALFQSRQR
jgi:hypothetical protein